MSRRLSLQAAKRRALLREQAKPGADLERVISRIAELSDATRASWFLLLGYLAYVTITLLGVTDADFFMASRQTQLPLVNVAIPTQSFFWFAPSLGAVLYIYLHMQLSRLWEVLGDARRTFGGEPVRLRAFPSLINDLALTYGRTKAAIPRPLDWLGNPFSGLLVWIAAPTLTLACWWRSMPAHEQWLTLWIAACLILSLYVGFTSWDVLRRQVSKHRERTPFWWRMGGALLATVAGLAFLATSWAGAEGGLADYGVPKINFRPLVSADLKEVELVPRPLAWRSRDTASIDFLDVWCRRQGLAPHDCGAAKNDKPFLDAWDVERHAYLLTLPKLDMSNRDLRGANLQRAFLPRAYLRGTRLDGALLWETEMEEDELQGASFVGASLWGTSIRAQLEGAHFDDATINGVHFGKSWMYRVTMDNAVMSQVNMDEATLTASQVSGWFQNVSAKSAKFGGATFGPSVFISVDLSNAEGLTQSQLDLVVGDNSDILPRDAKTGSPLHIWSCWETPPQGFDAFEARLKPLQADDALRAKLCAKGTTPEETGTPAN